MSNFQRFAMIGTILASGLAGEAHATQWQVGQGDNMVSLPTENMVVVPETQPQPRPPEDNMVIVDDGESVFVPITGPNYIEAGVNYHNVSNHQGDWSGQFVNAQLQTDPMNRWNVQLQHERAFKDEGDFVALGNMHTFDDKWFSDVSAGLGSSASFLPRFRADADINRRWLEGGNLVTTGGVSFSKADETYTSYGLLAGVSYYFEAPWVVQAGARVDMSNPGQVIGNSEFVALTYGHPKNYYLTGRVGIAHEAYQLLGGGNINSEFNSQNAGLNWRQWLGDDWGFNLGGEYYRNPYYHRTGGILSAFKEFGASPAALFTSAESPESYSYFHNSFIRPYAGIEYDYMHMKTKRDDANFLTDFTDNPYTTNFSAGVPDIGVRIGDYFGLEAGYLRSTDETRKFEGTGAIAGSTGSMETTLEGWSIDANGYYPIINRVEMVGSVGVGTYELHTKAREHFVIFGTPLGDSIDSRTLNDTALRLGAGLQYNYSDKISLRGMLRYIDLQFKDPNQTVVSGVWIGSLGANYNF